MVQVKNEMKEYVDNLTETEDRQTISNLDCILDTVLTNCTLHIISLLNMLLFDFLKNKN